MPRKAADSDRHLKRVASDADHWRNWLERLAELRRASEGAEPAISPAETSPGRAMLTGPNPRFRATPSPLKRPRDVPNLASDKPI
jgi:hypothetical protein